MEELRLLGYVHIAKVAWKRVADGIEAIRSAKSVSERLMVGWKVGCSVGVSIEIGP